MTGRPPKSQPLERLTAQCELFLPSQLPLKPKTPGAFWHPNKNGSFEAFSLYSMRQAIEEGFILDVLQNYITYKAYWQLLKKN